MAAYDLQASYYTSRWTGEEIDRLLEGGNMVITERLASLAALRAKYPSGKEGYYITADTGDVYWWDKAAGAWVSLGKIQGPQGPSGPGIDSIQRTGGSGMAGSTDTYTIYLSDGKSYTFTVYNGIDGNIADAEAANELARRLLTQTTENARAAAESAKTAVESASTAVDAADRAVDNAQAQVSAAKREADRAEVSRKAIEALTMTAKTLPPGSEVTVEKTLIEGFINFLLGIPRGEQGTQGPQGEQGVQGPPGPQGEPGINGVAVEAAGQYAFNVDEDGHLWLYYTGEEVPDFSLEEDGHLYLNME